MEVVVKVDRLGLVASAAGLFLGSLACRSLGLTFDSIMVGCFILFSIAINFENK